MPYYAHSIGTDRTAWQPLKDHLQNTAERAALFGSTFDAADWVFLCGLVHDLGKYSKAFQKRLDGGPRVDHSMAGAIEVKKLLDAAMGSPLPGNLLAHVISGHHTGLADGGDLRTRQDACASLPDYGVWQQELDLPDAPSLPPFFQNLQREEAAFALCFWTRMLFSCLVDADFLDTELALQPEKAMQRGNYPQLKDLLPPLDATLAALASAKPANGTGAPYTVNAHRASVLDACRACAAQPPGLFSLTVPTGGGKTLSSLAFALNHAVRHGMERVIYVIPYTSIIEQTADVFRKVLGPGLSHAVLEHHSNVTETPPDATAKETGKSAKEYAEQADDRDDSRTLAYENWDAPLIVTTTVQFFESLFASRSSRCRKLHNIARSVVILDEAQTLPVPLLRPTLAALTELVNRYTSSIVLCTATQPEVGQKPWNRDGLKDVREIVPDVPCLFNALERVRAEYLGPLELEQLAGLMAEQDRALCIVATRAQARELTETLHAMGRQVLHLSTWMCPEHRRRVLAEARARLATPGERLLLVSTSLIEAGVDIDFPVVFRALSGLDSLVQAAGRCNREGRLERGVLNVFELPGEPKGELGRRHAACKTVLENDLPLFSPEATRLYFDELYSLASAEGLDDKKILESIRSDWMQGYFPFRSVAARYRLIESGDEASLIIPYSAEAQAALDAVRDGGADRAAHRRLRAWTVSLREKELAALARNGSAGRVGFGSPYYELLNEDLYSGLVTPGALSKGPELGLDTRDPLLRDAASLVL